MSGLALLREGALGLAQLALRRRRMIRHLGAALGRHYEKHGCWPAPDAVAAQVIAFAKGRQQALEFLRFRRALRAHRLGYRIGRWWRDPDARVFAGCMLLLALWVVAR